MQGRRMNGKRADTVAATFRYTSSAQSPQPPTLGSKVVSVAGHAWTTGQETSTPDADMKNEELFINSHMSDGHHERGIPVSVERSIV